MTHEPKRWDDTGLVKLLKYWQLIVSILILSFSVGIASKTVDGLDKRVSQEEKQNDDQEKRLVQQEQLSEDVKRRLDRMENKLDSILRAVR